MFALPDEAAMAPTLMIFPPPAASIPGTTARAQLSTDLALRSSMRSQVSSLVSCTGCPMRKPPAMLQRISIRVPVGRARATDCASRRSAGAKRLALSSPPYAERRCSSCRSMRMSEAPSAANAAATARPRFPAAPVIRQVLPPKLTARRLRGRAALGLRPVPRRGLCVGESARVLESGCHGRRGPGEHLVVVDVEQPQPALLPQGEPDHAAQLDQFGLVVVSVQALRECVVGRGVPGDRLRVGERRLLALVVAGRLLELEQVPHLVLDDRAARRRFHRALVAAVLALHGARDIEAAQLLDRMIEHAVPEDVVPGVGEEPEAGGHVRADRRALGARRALALAALHLPAHLRVHLLERNVADPLLRHGASPRKAYCGLMPAPLITRAYSSCSLRTNFAKSSGDMSMVSLPRFCSRSRTVGSASALRVSAEIFATMSLGVPAGAQMPNHSGASAPCTPASPVVGTSGSWPLRLGVLTARARTLPPLMWGIAAEIGAQ